MNKVVIIGSGPAGLTAAIYTARAQLAPLVIEGLEPGGQLTTTTIIENWPGFQDGIDGAKLMADMREQAKRFGTTFKSGVVSSVTFNEQPLAVSLADETIQSQSVIIATGAAPRLLGLAAESKLMGRGVSSCATCDGFFFRGKDVLVVGGGDTAMEDAIYLSNLAKTVTVVHRRNQLRASKVMQEKAFAVPNISFLWDSVIEDIHDLKENTVTGASIKNIKTGAVTKKACNGIFMALGHIPNTALFNGQIELDAQNFITTKHNSATNITGVFAAGDVTDPTYKQAITAAGMGCMAALDAERYLQRL
ncbi:MAG: thioredoxin-disulfide reductase [Deltaproteobacteria bacterium]|nr:thioredoxin-disulfide reductase [Deltaproteobacteria bacterium]